MKRMIIVVAVWAAACSSPTPDPPAQPVVTAETLRQRAADVREARAYEYFKRMFIENVSWCDSQNDFINALFRLGVSCGDIKGMAPVDAFKHVRAITNASAPNATLRKIKLDLYNEADDN